MGAFSDKIVRVEKTIREYVSDFNPKVGIILGSGLGSLADKIQKPIEISYEKIPGFPVSTVAGHSGTLICGFLSNVPVMCLKGRVHMYEGNNAEGIKIFIRTLKHMGCELLINTNASGSLRAEVLPGEISLITDHINLSIPNPMIGQNDEEYGPRFFPMDNAYDKEFQQKFHAVAKEAGITLHEGVLIACLGPSFETPAEIRAFRILGADLVSMSTIPEVITAAHCGLKVAAISAVTNLAAGMSIEQLTHEGTLRGAKLAEDKMCQLIETFLARYADDFSK